MPVPEHFRSITPEKNCFNCSHYDAHFYGIYCEKHELNFSSIEGLGEFSICDDWSKEDE